MAKPGYKRANRVADQIRMEVADILMRKAKDPRVGFVTVTDVELSRDLRLARVFVSVAQNHEGEATTLAALDRAVGFVRTELGRRLHLRYTPEVVFHKDQAQPRAERMLSLLDELHGQDNGVDGEAPDRMNG
ncbi:MAG: 30S ribosome-binding factor RbfA [Nitrospirales bacterium]